MPPTVSMKPARRSGACSETDAAEVAAREGQEQVPVVIDSDADFVRCPNRSCSALLPLRDDEQICGYCGRWTGPLG